jgi:hypothetical protein
VLFMPASNARAVEKARTLDADGLIFDLEDAVAPDAKPAARDQIARALAAGGYGARELFLRVNALSTAWATRTSPPPPRCRSTRSCCRRWKAPTRCARPRDWCRENRSGA